MISKDIKKMEIEEDKYEIRQEKKMDIKLYININSNYFFYNIP